MILVIGIGGAVIHVTETAQVSSMAFAALTGIILNLIMPGREEATAESLFEAAGEQPLAEPAE